MPNIPDIKPDINIDKDKSINLLIAAVALTELGLAHIVNAEAEKIQFVLGTLKKHEHKEPPTIDELLKINKSVEKMLKKVIKKEMLLEFMLEEAVDMAELPEKDNDEDDDTEDDEGD